MKYIRMKDHLEGLYIDEFTEFTEYGKEYYKNCKIADTIEELCDELVIKYKNEEKPRYVDMNELIKSCDNIGVAFRKHIEWLFVNYNDQLEICSGAIWTDKGLIYVAKMNEKGELELI